MFGYLRMYKSSLTLQERKIYRDYYCSLCLSLGQNYGRHAKFLLSYDTAFFVAILYPENLKLEPCGQCGKGIEDKKSCFSQEFFRKAAMYHMLLIRMKLIDNIRDHNSLRSRMMYKFFLLVYPRCRNTDRYMHYIDEFLEAETKTSDMHELMESYKRFISGPLNEIFRASPEKINLIVSLSVWIYFIDAIDDYDSDLRSGEFNLVIADGKRYDSERELVRQEGKYLERRLEELLTDIRLHYRKGCYNHRQRIILENLINQSIPHVSKLVIDGKRIPHEKLL